MAGRISRFGVLGPLVLEREGDPVPLPSGRPRALLALLLLGGGVPLSRDRLIDELWGEHPPASAVSALHVQEELVDRLLERFSIPGSSEVALLRAVAFLDYSPTAKHWHRRLAARAAEIGDHEAVATATGNLFGQALNARDREEMRRLRPQLLALNTPECSAKALGWIHYFLALDAYVDGRFEAATEHAVLSVEKAKEIGHEFMLASAAGTHLLSASALDGAIRRSDLAETFELMRRPGVPPLAAFALWFVARYAAGVDADAALRWLAHAERIVHSLDSELWPESVLREETLAVLGIEDLAPALEQAPPLEPGDALLEASEWLAERDHEERAPREVELVLS